MSSSFAIWSILLTLCFMSFVTINIFTHKHHATKTKSEWHIQHNSEMKEKFLDNGPSNAFKIRRRQEEKKVTGAIGNGNDVLNKIYKKMPKNDIVIPDKSNIDKESTKMKENNLKNEQNQVKEKKSFVSGGYKNYTAKNIKKDKQEIENKKTDKVVSTKASIDTDDSDLSGLSCEKYGDPSYTTEYNKKIINDMIYWSDIPSDSNYKSPFFDTNKYITFEPDNGGWNNIRMSMETILVLAYATGRTLVLPPSQKFYLLDKGNEHKKSFGFEDFFHMDSIGKHHTGLNIITMEEFLSNVIMKEKLVDDKSNKPFPKPPDNRVDWSVEGTKPFELWKYLRSIGVFNSKWEPWECLFTIPTSNSTSDIEELQTIMTEINDIEPSIKSTDYVGKPVPVNTTTLERLKENLDERKRLCIYDTYLQNVPLIHIHAKTEASRFLTPFYSFIFFQNYKVDLWVKRFIRDHVRYIDEIMCASSRIISSLRQSVMKLNATNVNGDYHSIHVRRGDFQYKPTRLKAEELLEQSQKYFDKNSVIYIATDERDKSFFKPFKDYYQGIYFLDDFLDDIPGINVNYYGMLDQLVCTKSVYFIGTWWSTFSAYINRMRAYHVTKDQYHNNIKQDGLIDSWYFDPYEFDRKNEMRIYHPVRKPLYMREFPTSWRDIDNAFDIISE